MKVRCLKAINIDLTVGAEYEVIGVENVGDTKCYRIIDDSGDDYLYGINCFEIIKSA